MKIVNCESWETGVSLLDGAQDCGFLVKHFPGGRTQTIGTGSALLISPALAISAAHNFFSQIEGVTYSVVFLKETDGHTRKQEVAIDRIINGSEDLCLLELGALVEIVPPARIATDTEIELSEEFSLIGFGTKSRGYDSMELSKGLLAYNSFFNAYRTIQNMQDGMSVEVRTFGRIDDGDSGAGVYAKYDGELLLVGIQITESTVCTGEPYSTGGVIIFDTLTRHLLNQLNK